MQKLLKAFSWLISPVIVSNFFIKFCFELWVLSKVFVSSHGGDFFLQFLNLSNFLLQPL
eukprot:Gb_18208 [translate_table: standard]